MKNVFIIIALLASFGSIAQKVDLDRFSFSGAYLSLPKEYVEPDKRTYGIRVQSNPRIAPADMIYDRIRVDGYQLVESNPTVAIEVYFDSFVLTGAELKERVEESKDKEGKVTSRRYYYAMVVTYRTEGNYSIRGPMAEDAKKNKEEKPASTNRFLQKLDALDNTSNKTVRNSASINSTYTTREFSNSSEAREFYRDNQRSIKDEITNQWINNTINNINSQLSRKYGFNEQRTNDFLWILDSKSHPEYPIQQDAIKAIKVMMPTMSGEKSIKGLAEGLEPVMSYFQELKTKYASDDKRDRKMRYSAFYNLAKLYYYLDQPEKMIEEANGLIKNEYDESDGATFLRQAKELREDLDRQKMETRHFN